jgi:hypothetical protein
MKCPICKEKDLKSKVYSKGSSTTLMGYSSYYDEEGVYHNHDPNTHTSYYNCSEGHEWIEKYKSKCSSCDYGKEESKITVLNNTNE